MTPTRRDLAKRPLRELFPTQNGHRLWKCPNCGNPMGRRADGYRCLNISAGCHRTIYSVGTAA